MRGCVLRMNLTGNPSCQTAHIAAIPSHLNRSCMATSSRFSWLAVAGLAGIAACAGGGDNGPTALAPSVPRLALGLAADNTPVKGQLKVCKSASSNVAGTFSTVLTQFVAAGFPAPG